MYAWVTLMYQIIRLYCLQRITLKSFKHLAGISGPQDLSIPKSNLYTTPEMILLKWLNYHQRKVLHSRSFLPSCHSFYHSRLHITIALYSVFPLSGGNNET